MPSVAPLVKIETTMENYGKVVLRLAELGVFHPTEISASKEQELEEVRKIVEKLELAISEIEEIRSYLESYGFKIEGNVKELCYNDLHELVTDILNKVQIARSHIDAIEEINNMIKLINKSKINLLIKEILSVSGLPSDFLKEFNHFAVKVYFVEEKDVMEVEKTLRILNIAYAVSHVDEKGAFFICSVPTERKNALARVAQVIPLEEISIDLKPCLPLDKNAHDKLIESLRKSLREIDVLFIITSLKEDLEKLLKMAYNSRNIGKTIFFEGYVDERKLNLVKKTLHNLASIVVVGPNEDSPRILQLPKPLAYFYSFTEMYGGPSIREIDPTPILIITFPLFFGIMFADLGQGIILALVGLYAYHKMNNKPWGVLLTLSGIWSAFFGVAFGEVFGYSLEEFIDYHPLLPMHEHGGINSGAVIQLLGYSVLAGVIHLCIALSLRTLNRLLEGKWTEGLLRELFMLIIYISGVFVVASSFLGLLDVPIELLMNVILYSILIYIFGVPIYELLKRNTSEAISSFGNGIMEFCLSISELLSNTISYARLGVVSLVHASLMLIITTSASAGLLISLPIQIIGNAGVMALEGLIAFIQALRLNFYEFMTKFYEGEGHYYNPIRLSLITMKGF